MNCQTITTFHRKVSLCIADLFNQRQSPHDRQIYREFIYWEKIGPDDLYYTPSIYTIHDFVLLKTTRENKHAKALAFSELLIEYSPKSFSYQ